MSDKTNILADTQVISEHGEAQILLASRDEELRDNLEKTFVDDNFEVKTVLNVWEVFEALIDYTYDLLIADSNLPGTTCIELVKYCKKRHPAMEIIILAYDPTIPDAVALTKAGVFNYIEMAVDEEVITAQSKSALKEKKDKLIKHLMPNWALNKNIFKFLPDLDIIRQLGTGSTGIVFQVRKSNAFYALKILRSDLAPEMHQLQREGKFLSEAEILSKLKHNNIVQIFDYGFSENFMPYILMEFVNGKTLTEIIKNNKLDFKKRLNIFIQTCKAIQFIHKNGILHRDIKPGNIIVSDDLAVKLTDFGLAHIIDADGDETGNIIIGSPAYMSPETFDKNAAVDHSSDIFSLGILGYELFTGEKPFIGNNILEIRHSICHRKPPAPRKIVPELEVEIEKILSKMLAKKPQDRFENLSKVINSGSKILADSNMYKEAKKNKSLFGLFKGRSSTWA